MRVKVRIYILLYCSGNLGSYQERPLRASLGQPFLRKIAVYSVVRHGVSKAVMQLPIPLLRLHFRDPTCVTRYGRVQIEARNKVRVYGRVSFPIYDSDTVPLAGTYVRFPVIYRVGNRHTRLPSHMVVIVYVLCPLSGLRPLPLPEFVLLWEASLSWHHSGQWS
jgi:hypothetical protein